MGTFHVPDAQLGVVGTTKVSNPWTAPAFKTVQARGDNWPAPPWGKGTSLVFENMYLFVSPMIEEKTVFVRNERDLFFNAHYTLNFVFVSIL